MSADTTAPVTPPTPARKRREGRRTGKSPASEAIRYVLLVFFAALILMPLYVLLVTSFKTSGGAGASEAWLLPGTWSVDGWVEAFTRLAPALVRSLIMAVVAAAVSAMLGSLNGFVFAKWKFPGADIIFTMFLFGMFIPYQAVMIPLQGMLLDVQKALPFVDGIGKLILVHVIYGIPICTLIFRNYYATAVPNEMLEAAEMDGAGMMATYLRIVLPVSLPGFVVALIWQFTSAWNDFLFALFLTTRNDGPVTYMLMELAGGQNPNYPQIMAGVMVASLPTLIVYILLGKYFVSGLMAGSVK